VTEAAPSAAAPPPHVRFNFAALVGDVTCFLIGMAFLDTATALPAIVERLGGGPAFLGFLLGLRQAAYYLPPLFVAHFLQGRTRNKPILVRVCLAGRVFLFAAPWAIWQFGDSRPAVALGVLALAYTMSWAGDGAGSVPWTALVGRAIPPQRRGSLFATSQVVSAIGRLVVGVVVLALLGSGRVPFPANAALLALGCAGFLFVSWLFLAALREPPPAVEAEFAASQPREPLRVYLRTMPGRMRRRPEFARLALAQVLASAAPASAPFIVAYAERETNAAPLLTRLPGAVQDLFALLQTGGLPGLFLIVQTLGLILLAPLWGWLTDRYGPKTALRGIFGLSILSPVCALLAGYTPGGVGGTLLLFLLAYFCFGAVQDGWVPMTNYLLEIVPEAEQPTYIALMNAASAPALLLPFAAGLLADRVGPRAAFFGAVVLLLAGLWTALTLPETRRESAKPTGTG
jgi:MFS family permease